MNIRSLRFKLGWNHGLIISVVFVCIGLIRYQTVSYRARSSFDQDLQSDAGLLASHLKPGSNGIEVDDNGLPVHETLTLESLRRYFVVTDTRGNVLGQNTMGRYIEEMVSRKALDKILRQKGGFGQAVAADGTIFRFVNLPLSADDGLSSLVLHVGRPMDALQTTMEEYYLNYVISVPLILFISVLVGWFLAGRALRPFEYVTQTAKQITSKNLNTQIFTKSTEVEIQELVQSFNAMAARLNRSFQQIRKFNADVAHELRTPLSIMQGENEIALRSKSLPEEIRSVLSSNLEELGRLTRIVNDLLTLSEAEAGHQVIVKRPINLKPLLQDLVEQMRVLAMDRNIQIEFVNPPNALIQGDALWIRRAFLNLLDNAIKYSKEQSKIVVEGLVDDHTVRLWIQDSGIGIPAEDIPYIFDRLYRADPARSKVTPGSGLGLALVKWIVEAHDGEIKVSSHPDRGSNFEVVFPLLAA